MDSKNAPEPEFDDGPRNGWDTPPPEALARIVITPYQFPRVIILDDTSESEPDDVCQEE